MHSFLIEERITNFPGTIFLGDHFSRGPFLNPGKMVSGKIVPGKMVPEKLSPENWSPENWSPEK